MMHVPFRIKLKWIHLKSRFVERMKMFKTSAVKPVITARERWEDTNSFVPSCS